MFSFECYTVAAPATAAKAQVGLEPKWLRSYLCMCICIYIYTSVLLCIYMHRESGSETEVVPVVKLIWKLESQKTITISITNLITIVA